MARIITIILLLFVLVGCGTKPIRIKTEIQESYVPILYCPAPPEIKRPVLAIDLMTEEQLNDPGELVKHYKATIIQLQGYITELETIRDSYDESNEAYDELRKQFKEEWENKISEDAVNSAKKKLNKK